MKTDGYMLACYRRHVGNSEHCGCNFDSADRACDLGWALWKCVNPRKADA